MTTNDQVSSSKIAQDARDEVIATLTASRDRLRACMNDDFILAWFNGLGVAFSRSGEAIAVHLDNAFGSVESAAFNYTTVRNGNGEIAQPIRRQVAISLELEKLDEFITKYSAI